MKKKILLALTLIAVFVCLFAFAASAEEYTLVDNLGTPSWYTGNYELITDKASQVVLSNGDGTYTAYPAYYILKYSISVSNGVVTEAYINGFDYSFVNEKTEKNYEAGAIYKIELPNGLTKVASGYFGHNPKEPNVVELVMSDSITRVDDHAFRKTTSLKKIVFSKNLTYIGDYAFYQSSALEEFVLPAGSDEYLDISKSNIFAECVALEEADLSNRKIKVLGSALLSKCSALGKVTLPDTVEEIGGYFLFECTNAYLASDFLPTSLKKIGFQFFSGPTNGNSVLYFPEGFTGENDAFTATYVMSTQRYKTPDTTLVFLGKMTGTIALEQFHPNTGCKMTLVFTQNDFSDLAGKIVGAASDGTKAYVITADTSDTDYYEKTGTLTIKIGNSSDSHSKYTTDANGNTLYYVHDNSFNFYFCGGDDVEVCYGIRGNKVNADWGNYVTDPFTFDKDAHMTANKHYDLTEVLSTANCGYDGVVAHTCVVCDRVKNDIDPATGDHTLVDASVCAEKCTTCLKYIQKAIQSHAISGIMEYENGFAAAGLQSEICTNEGCSHCVSDKIPALFANLGYSFPEDGSAGISSRFRVDKDAVKAYEDFTGNKISYGLFAGLESKIGNNDIVDADGKAIDGAVTADLTSGAFTVFEIKMHGFKDGEETTPFAIGAYIVEVTDKGTKYSYLQSGAPEENEKYCFIKYEDFVSNQA